MDIFKINNNFPCSQTHWASYKICVCWSNSQMNQQFENFANNSKTRQHCYKSQYLNSSDNIHKNNISWGCPQTDSGNWTQFHRLALLSDYSVEIVNYFRWSIMSIILNLFINPRYENYKYTYFQCYCMWWIVICVTK